MKLHHSVEQSFNQKTNRFVIRYIDNEINLGWRKNGKVLSKAQNSTNHHYLGSQSQLFPMEKKKSRRPNIETQVSTSAQVQRKKPIQKIKRTDSIDNLSQIRQKQYSRVPVEYFDQKDNGCGADKNRMRVVYRGYAPKNTYFFLKTIKQINFNLKPNVTNLRNDYDLKFNSKFQSGNLSAVSKISTKQYWLFMREDTNTHGLRQWFYFQITNKKATQIKFRIYKYTKHYSLYKQGMKPYVKVGKNGQWKQDGDKVKYQYDNQQKSFYLEFEYNFEHNNSDTYFATLPPYTYSYMIEYISMLKQAYDETIKTRILGKSLAGLDIPLIQIKKKNDGRQSILSPQKQNRPSIFIMARTHPGQTVSNYTLQALIDKILKQQKLREYYDFYIVPMVNPDGVFLGNHRTGALGVDLNRNFHTCDPQIYPQVTLIIEQVNRLKKNTNLKFVLDLHGHSARRNIFAYGQQHQIGTSRHLFSRILPKILSDTISTFKYDFCVFRACKQKKNTARVFFSNRFKVNSITFQQSYGLINQGTMGITHWRNFGTALGDSLLYFGTMCQNGQTGWLENYLADQIIKQKQKNHRRLQRQKKMLELNKITQINNQSNLQNSLLQNDIKNIDSNKSQKKTQLVSLQNIQQNQSVNQSQLSSGDQDLQLHQQELQIFKKQIIRVGCMKEGFKRQSLNMADKKLQLYNWDCSSQPRLHQQKSSMVPRIIKMQMKKKDGNTVGTSLSSRPGNVQLPTIRKRQ